MSVRLDRVEAAVVACVLALAPSGTVAVWSRSLYPHRNSDPSVVTAKVVRGPSVRPAELIEVDEPTVLRWSLAAVAAGARVGIAMTGARWYVDAVSTDVTAVRDALLALFTDGDGAEFLPGVTVAAIDDDTIEFDADGVPGLLFSPVAIGVAAIEVITAVPSEVAMATSTLVVELQAYAQGGGSDASGILASINGGMSMSAAVDIRHDLGIVYHGAEEPVDLSAIAGADWESRASTRWQLSTRSYIARAIPTIETVETTLTIYNGAEPIEIVINSEQ